MSNGDEEIVETLQDEQQIVAHVKKFTEMFGALFKVSAKLEEVGSLRKATGEARTKMRAARAELGSLQDQQSARYKEIYDVIERGVLAQHAEAQKLVARKDALQATAQELDATITERKRKITQLNAEIDKLQARHRDLEGRLDMLARGFQQLESDRRPAASQRPA
jgi:uncharacterized coiled-coil DUF342 family protein